MNERGAPCIADTGCGLQATAVSGVQLTPPAAALAAGEKTAIQVVIEPENATVQTVT